MEVLFEFETNIRFAQFRHQALCDTIRKFLTYKYLPFKTAIDTQLEKGDAAYLLVSFGIKEVRLIPHNIPSEIFDIVSRSITQADFDELQKSLLN